MEQRSDLKSSLNTDVSRTLDQMELQQPTSQTVEEKNSVSTSQSKILMLLGLMILIVFAVMIGVNVSNSNESSSSNQIEHSPSIDPPEDKPSLSPQYRTLIPIQPTENPSNDPSHSPDTQLPSNNPSKNPQSVSPSNNPTLQTVSPSDKTDNPTLKTEDPTLQTVLPSDNPTLKTNDPTLQTVSPSNAPQITPTEHPSLTPNCVRGGFSSTVRGCRIESCSPGNGASCIFKCQTPYDAGYATKWKYTSINLNEHIAYNPQKPQLFEFNENGGFMGHTTRPVDVWGVSTIKTYLYYPDGLHGDGSWFYASIDLNKYIINDNGQLKWSCFH